MAGSLTTFTLDATTMAPAEEHIETPTVKRQPTPFDTNRSAVSFAVVVGADTRKRTMTHTTQTQSGAPEDRQ
jgi:hypothetical protein